MKRGRWKIAAPAAAAVDADLAVVAEAAAAVVLVAAVAAVADLAAVAAVVDLAAAVKAVGVAAAAADAAVKAVAAVAEADGADAAAAAGIAIAEIVVAAAATGASAELEAADTTSAGFQWKVVLFNCDCHTFDDVETQLIKATRCSLGRARELAWKVHSEGQAVVYNGPAERCEAVAAVLEDIKLMTKVTQ